MRGLSLVVASGGHSSSRCAGLSLLQPLLLRSTGSRRAGSVIVAHGPSCSTACGILPDQGSNPRPLYRQADSQPLRHQGSPQKEYLKNNLYYFYNLYQCPFFVSVLCFCSLPLLLSCQSFTLSHFLDSGFPFLIFGSQKSLQMRLSIHAS